jgi:hypothetical protein
MVSSLVQSNGLTFHLRQDWRNSFLIIETYAGILSGVALCYVLIK